MKRDRRQLGELCNLVKGTSPISKTLPGPYPLVTTGEEHKTADTFQFEAEAVCIPLISSTGHGHASLKRVHYQTGKFALANLLAAALVRDPSVLSAKFLMLYLTATKDRLIVPLMTGAANMGISIDRLGTVPVEFPPLAVQERIVKLLEEVDALRKLRTQADLRTGALLPALFHEMFGDRDTNPQKLPIVPLGSLVSFRTGKLDSNAAVKEGLYPFFTCSREDSRINTYAFDCEALLLAGNNAVGEYSVKYYKGKFNAYQRTYVLNLLDADHSYGFMQQALQLRLQELKRLSLGTNTKYLTLGILKNIEIPLPDSALQKQFAARVADVRKLQNAQEQSRTRLGDLFQSSLHQAFEGKL